MQTSTPADPPRVALVTGAAVRLGAAIALALGERGYRIVLHCHSSRAEAERLAERLAERGAGARVAPADLTRPANRERLMREAIEEAGGLDLLVNSAGLLVADDGDALDLARMKVLNYDTPESLMRAAEPALAERGGSVVNIADVAAMRAFARCRAYSRTKAALLELTFRRALDLAPRGVRVNAVCPGAVLFAPSFDEAARRRILAGVPLSREGAPADVAGAVCYLAQAPYVTGQALAVDGCQLLTLLDKNEDDRPPDSRLN